MFKKSLLALALAGTASFAANAVNTLSDQINVQVSAQGAASTETILQSDLTGTNLLLTLDTASAAALTAGDDLVISISGATWGTGTNIVPVFADGINTDDTDVVLTATPAYTGGNTATIAVGAVTAGTEGIEALNTIAITGILVDGASAVASGEVEVTVSFIDSASTLTYGSVTETLFTTEDQFSAVIAGGNVMAKTIEVADDRMLFNDASASDSFEITLDESAGTVITNMGANVTSVTYTLSSGRGFAYLDTDGDGTKDLAIVGSSAAVDGQDTFATTYSDDDTTVTIVQTVVQDGTDTAGTNDNAGLDTDVTITVPGGDTDTVISTDTFTVTSTTFAYTDATSAAGTQAATANLVAGTWSLDGGAVITVAGLPFAEGISHGVNIANTSATAGVAELVAMVDGVTTNHVLTTPIQADGVSKLGAEIKALGVTEGWDGKSVIFEIVVTVPEVSIETNAFFYVSDDSDRTRVPVTQL